MKTVVDSEISGVLTRFLLINQSIAYESIINIRPSQNNRSMLIQDPVIRERVKQIAQELIGGHEPEVR